MSKKFQRKIEDFKCEHCGFEVEGDGYTNHCPKCLWSKHVDINPGDRTETCEGLMSPVDAEKKRGEWRILHKCTRCRAEKWNKVLEEDDREAFLKIASGSNL